MKNHKLKIVLLLFTVILFAGKFIDILRVNNHELVELGSAPTTPESGVKSFYAKNDGKIYTLNSSGTESEITTGSATVTEVINYVGNNDIEIDSSGYNHFDDGATLVDGTGEAGATDLTVSRTVVAGEALRKTASLKMAKSANDAKGEGMSFDLTSVDHRDEQEINVIYIKFDYSVSAAYVDDDIIVAIYNKDGAALITLDGDNGLKDTSGANSTFYGSFKTVAGDDDYRLIWSIDSTNASAYDVFVDSIEVGPHGTHEVSDSTGTIGTSTGTNAQFQNVVTLSLTPGDWDINGSAKFRSLTTAPNDVALAISAFSGNTTTDHVANKNDIGDAVTLTSADASLVIPVYRMTVITTQTIYFKAKFTTIDGGTQILTSNISARKVR